jgi:hypothetical protein
MKRRIDPEAERMARQAWRDAVAPAPSAQELWAVEADVWARFAAGAAANAHVVGYEPVLEYVADRLLDAWRARFVDPLTHPEDADRG